ncbi:hypothetical protein OBBRIDRAFT_888933 [Obba rivulosa]|uniref:EF-hand domain-containing protein n=1 Tax=Obba rivulosa TaxID=1052685 RepID=A0A8E2APT4_9APHY|nr:hypothetical protein OBBRIDRAFT_888933 [Obba rivulosa]
MNNLKALLNRRPSSSQRHDGEARDQPMSPSRTFDADTGNPQIPEMPTFLISPPGAAGAAPAIPPGRRARFADDDALLLKLGAHTSAEDVHRSVTIDQEAPIPVTMLSAEGSTRRLDVPVRAPMYIRRLSTSSVITRAVFSQDGQALCDIVQSRIREINGNTSNTAINTGRRAALAAVPGGKSLNQTVRDINSCVQLFDEQLPGLVDLLDRLAEVHPAAKAAFAVVKTVFEMYLARRENDRRVQILYFRMNEVSGLFKELLTIRSLTEALHNAVTHVAADIKECAEACDAYLKTGNIVKFLKAGAWAKELASFLRRFDKAQSDLTLALSTDANKKLDNLQTSILNIETKFDEMVTILRDKYMTREETALSEELQDSKLGSEQDIERMLKKLLSKDLGGDSKSSGGRGITVVTDQRLESLKAELLQDTKQIIEKNGKEFNLKFDAALRKQTEQLTRTIQDSSNSLFDRITRRFDQATTTLTRGQRRIEQVTESINIPYKKINDPVLRDVWKHMNWAGHAESRQFVMALRDYFNGNLADIKKAASRGDPASQQIVNDEWALAYVGPKWQQRIMEAIDDDASGYVTIAELNKFTDALPSDLGWSLPRWLAYWAIGWQMTATTYLLDIRGILANMLSTLSELLPKNRSLGDQYFDNVWRMVFPLMASLETCFVSTALQSRFEGYVKYEKKLLEDNLKDVQYNVDAVDTLQVNIVGGGRIEKHIFQLTCLLLKKHLEILQGGRYTNLDEDVLEACEDSIQTCMRAVTLRMSDLSDYFQIQERKIDIKSQFETTACGMFKYFNESGDLWTASNVAEYALDRRDRAHSWEEAEEGMSSGGEAQSTRVIDAGMQDDVSTHDYVEGPRHTSTCDACGVAIHSERCICITCWDPEGQVWNSIDFCNKPECLSWDVQADRGIPHTPEHKNMVKVLYFLHINDKPSLLRDAKRFSERCAYHFEEILSTDTSTSESRSDLGDAPSISKPGPQEDDNSEQNSGTHLVATQPVVLGARHPQDLQGGPISVSEDVNTRIISGHDEAKIAEASVENTDTPPRTGSELEEMCIAEGKTAEEVTDWHVYTHPLLRYYHKIPPSTIETARPALSLDEKLIDVHRDIQNNMKVVQDRVEVVQDKMKAVQDNVGGMEAKLEALQNQMCRMEQRLDTLVAKFEGSFVSSDGANRPSNGYAGED